MVQQHHGVCIIILIIQMSKQGSEKQWDTTLGQLVALVMIPHLCGLCLLVPYPEI